MESLIETFHIDISLLLAQAINFAIVFLVIYFFALKPLMKVMGERTTKIEKSLNDAKEIEIKLLKTEEEHVAIMAQAKKDANDIIEQAREHADVKRKEMIVRAKEEIGQIINDEKAQIQAEKARTLKEIKVEVAGIVALALEKVFSKKIDAKEDGDFIKRALKE